MFQFMNAFLFCSFVLLHFKVKIELIESHAINGNIGEISFVGCTIESIRPFAFTTLKDHSMWFKMDGVRINNIEPQVRISNGLEK